MFTLENRGVSVVSDVDDTMKISNVPKKAELMKNTFLSEFKPAPGMSALFNRLLVDHHHEDISFHYVSARFVT